MSKSAKNNSVRIIAGDWRGRRLSVANVPGLRPSGDRSRETLFNWLQPFVVGADCADLFAGTGALGFEAASRGAASVSFIDTDPRAVRSLKENLSLLASDRGEVVQSDALAYLQGQPKPFDIIFLDPPFRQSLLQPCLEQLCNNDWLTTDARLYVEVEQELSEPELPTGWEMIRSKKAGQVIYGLAARC